MTFHRTKRRPLLRGALLWPLACLAACGGPTTTPPAPDGDTPGHAGAGDTDVVNHNGDAPGAASCAQATTLHPGVVSGDTRGESDVHRGTCDAGEGVAGDRMYRFTLQAEAAVTLSLTGFDAILYLYNDVACAASSEVTCTDVPGTIETIHIGALQAGTYWVVVDTFTSDEYPSQGGPYELSLEVTSVQCINDVLDESAGNDTAETAFRLPNQGVDTEANGPALTLCDGDIDWFLIPHLGGALSLALHNIQGGETPTGLLYRAQAAGTDPSGAVIYTPVTAEGAIAANIEQPRGTYLLEVTAPNAPPAGVGYTLRVSPACPGDSLDAPLATDEAFMHFDINAVHSDVLDPALVLCPGDADTFSIEHHGGLLAVTVAGTSQLHAPTGRVFSAVADPTELEQGRLALTPQRLLGNTPRFTSTLPAGYYVLHIKDTQTPAEGTPYSIEVSHGCSGDAFDHSDPQQDNRQVTTATSLGLADMQTPADAPLRLCPGDVDLYVIEHAGGRMNLAIETLGGDPAPSAELMQARLEPNALQQGRWNLQGGSVIATPSFNQIMPRSYYLLRVPAEADDGAFDGAAYGISLTRACPPDPNDRVLAEIERDIILGTEDVVADDLGVMRLCPNDSDAFIFGHMGGHLSLNVTDVDSLGSIVEAVPTPALLNVGLLEFNRGAQVSSGASWEGALPRGYYIMSLNGDGLTETGSDYAISLTHACHTDALDSPVASIDDGDLSHATRLFSGMRSTHSICAEDTDAFILESASDGDIVFTATNGMGLTASVFDIEGILGAEELVDTGSAPVIDYPQNDMRVTYTTSSVRALLVVSMDSTNPNPDAAIFYTAAVQYDSEGTPPTNSQCSAAAPLVDGEVTQGFTMGAGTALLGSCNGDRQALSTSETGSAPEVFYRFTLDTAQDAVLEFDGRPSRFTGSLALYSGINVCSDDLSTLTPVRDETGAPGCTTEMAASLRYPLLAPGEYVAVVDGRYTPAIAFYEIPEIATAGSFAIAARFYPGGFPATPVCADAATIAIPAQGATTTLTFDNTHLSNHRSVYPTDCTRGGGGNERAFRLEPQADVTLQISARGHDTILSIHRSTCDGTHFVGCNDDRVDMTDPRLGGPAETVGPADLGSEFTATLTAGSVYFLVVDAFSASAFGNVLLSMTTVR